MKIARCETYQETPGNWRWIAVGLRGGIIASSDHCFKTLKDCEEDMTKFRKEHDRIPTKQEKKSSFSFLKILFFWKSW